MEVGALIVDLDGVVRIWDPKIISDAERLWGLDPGALAAVAFGDSQLLHRAVTGDLTDHSWREEIITRLRPVYGAAARSAVEQWSLSAGSVNHEVLALIRQVRRRVPIALLSNATTRLERDLAALSLDSEFDLVLNTARLRLAKPDARVFTAAARALRLANAECVFVDDTPEHVAAARSTGMRGHHFTNAADFRSFLSRLRLP